MIQQENNGNRGWTLAELIPALAIFGIASVALLAGFLQLSGLVSARPGYNRGSEALAGAARETARILADAGSDPWEAPPVCRMNGDTLTLTFHHNGRPGMISITCTTSQVGKTPPETVFTLTTDSGSFRATYPNMISAAPWCDSYGILRGILLAAGGDRNQSLFVPFGRQTP
jgi:hypothetical protein